MVSKTYKTSRTGLIDLNNPALARSFSRAVRGFFPEYWPPSPSGGRPARDSERTGRRLGSNSPTHVWNFAHTSVDVQVSSPAPIVPEVTEHRLLGSDEAATLEALRLPPSLSEVPSLVPCPVSRAAPGTLQRGSFPPWPRREGPS